jgi:hypothetical protein
MPRTEAARFAAWGVEVPEGASTSATSQENQSPPSNRSGGSGNDTEHSVGAIGETDESGSELRCRHKYKGDADDDDEIASTGADVSDLPEITPRSDLNVKDPKTMSFKKKLNLKLPSMRKLIHGKEDDVPDEGCTPKSTKSRPNSFSKELSERLFSHSKGDDGIECDDNRKKKGILSRSLNKISSISGFKKGKDDVETGNDDGYDAGDQNSETVKRVSTQGPTTASSGQESIFSASAGPLSPRDGEFEGASAYSSHSASVDTASRASGSKSATVKKYNKLVGHIFLFPRSKFKCLCVVLRARWVYQVISRGLLLMSLALYRWMITETSASN